MTDTPASWQPDPTGRHDHRYWDGTQWTDHVADAGVAGTDPYDGHDLTPGAPAGTAADPQAEDAGAPSWSGGEDTAVTATTPGEDDVADTTTGDDATTPTGDDAGPSVAASGWGASSEPTTEEPGAPEEPAAEAPSGAASTASGWARPDEPAPTVSGWGTTAPGWGATGTGTDPDEPAAAGTPADEATAVTPGASWGDATATTSAWTAPTEPVSEPLAAEATTAPAPPPVGTDDATPPAGDRRSRKVLLLVLALIVIVGVTVALVLTGGDGDDGDGDEDDIAERISSTLQEDLEMEEGPADCIGEHIVDEIGASRLQDVDFDAPEAPADLRDDFDAAFNGAIAECDLEPEDLGTAGPGGDAAGDDEGDSLSDFGDPDEFAALLAESYESTLGIPEAKATCLAEQMVDAVESGKLTEDEAFSEFFQYLDACDISLEELSPTTAAG